AIEQPLDLSIPENKMMLAIYLAAPEVENDRRALNTYYGMRRAKKEGRLMGRAPYGYVNRITENGKKYVTPKEPEASNMQWAFNEMSKGVYSASQIMDMMNRKEGKSVKISAFLTSLRNTAYCGKIYVEQFNEEEAHFVTSIHEPLISEELFEKVQCIHAPRRYGDYKEKRWRIPRRNKRYSLQQSDQRDRQTGRITLQSQSEKESISQADYSYQREMGADHQPHRKTELCHELLWKDPNSSADGSNRAFYGTDVPEVYQPNG
ncbi:recombinase family protein, partial [Flavobacterium sp. B17]|uniref:recombinase family protein n=1 Tax=Flavobacterium sp. B17 TaxID=95618 RepID=UPI0005B2D453